MKPNKNNIVVIAHDIRSCENVGSILRTADAMAINKVYFTGLTPYPQQANDTRLPHIIRANHNKIAKSALGAENSVTNQHHPDIKLLVMELKSKNYKIVGLEQHKDSNNLEGLENSTKFALILGNEINGIEKKVLELCDSFAEIPMLGQKESLNVAQAAAIAMFHGRYF
jgi:23S rRNA (guanosine2251-2'-O)-methyltransferase